MGQALAGPGGKGAGIFDRNPSHRLVFPAFGVDSICPIAQKIVPVLILRPIVGCFEELFELSVGHRSTVDVETMDVDAMTMKAARRILPRVLHIDAGIVTAL